MKNANMNDVLKKAMDDFGNAYLRLRTTIDRYEQTTGTSVNDLPFFTEDYPFDKSFDELAVDEWVSAVIANMPRPTNFKILSYQYLNTGGNTMVGIHDVWLPEEKKVVYVYTNEEGSTISTVDYIRYDLEIDDYDEFIVDYVDWGRITGHEKYFELYRYCYNRYLVDDCKYFGITRGVQYSLLSDKLQEMLAIDYVKYIEAECGSLFETDGEIIVTNPDYEAPEVDVALQSVKIFKKWHDSIAANEDYYNDWYILEIHGKKVKLPFYADVWNAVNNLLETTIEEW